MESEHRICVEDDCDTRSEWNSLRCSKHLAAVVEKNRAARAARIEMSMPQLWSGDQA